MRLRWVATVLVATSLGGTACIDDGSWVPAPPMANSGTDLDISGPPCGPCGLGIEDESCALGGLSGLVSETVECSELVFVGGTEMGEGRLEAPYSAEQWPSALQAAKAGGIRAIIIVGETTIEGPVEMVSGVHLVGGLTTSGVWDASVRPSIVTQGQPGDREAVGVLGEGLDVRTVIRAVNIETQGEAHSHYAARFLNSTEVVLEDVSLSADDGANGAAGAPGEPGTDGSNGGNAGRPETWSPGEAAVNDACSRRGGRGGKGATTTGQIAESGQQADSGTLGGVANGPGDPGDTGQVGDPGQDGTRILEASIDEQGRFVPTPPEPATAGSEGASGGGGGGGIVDGTSGVGGGGGGGGSAGCGGAPGGPGEDGGVSIGLVASESFVRLDSVTIQTGRGGQGGPGGMGGAGGLGGRGGVGEPGSGSGGTSGGNGGDGGPGGPGGSGAPGFPGSVFGVACGQGARIAEQEVTVELGSPGQTPPVWEGLTARIWQCE